VFSFSPISISKTQGVHYVLFNKKNHPEETYGAFGCEFLWEDKLT
jgi:hypothetical protein